MSIVDVLYSYSVVFAKELGIVQGVTAAIHVDPTETHKVQPLPYSLKVNVKKELEHLK